MNNDPYTNISNCVKRLHNEYQKHKRLIIATDFDDTCYPYHDKSETHEKVLELLRKCKKANFYVVVFTASKPERFSFITEYMTEQGIEIDSINKNPIPLPFGNHGKIYYNILLDDRAGLKDSCDVLSSLLEYVLCDKDSVDSTDKKN